MAVVVNMVNNVNLNIFWHRFHGKPQNVKNVHMLQLD